METIASNPNLPSYLRVLPQYRVILCITHGSCYTHHNLDRHLRDKHRVPSYQRQQIEQSNELQSVARTSGGVVQPADGSSEVSRLPTVRGFLCHHPNYLFRTTSTDQIRKHYNQKHQ
ncbi:hypothetical protein FE257_005967 [Aspergillus nanangensis]|uniref:C2H2-type domain-containing protein n=1 Tax=Aspergillus nanangensis TaxID=2582783 RepID=A0AAD4CA13_ASPNN|nr:hypothetical protein FE257_005967 [Aspergillus nanangensis]